MGDSIIKVSLALITLSLLMIGVGFGVAQLGIVDLPDQIDNDDSTFVQPEVNISGQSSGNLLNDVENGGDIFNSTATVYATDGRSDDLSSIGSSFMYTDEHLMTNEHVVSGYSDVMVRYNNNTWSEAEVVGTDIHSDIAILKPEKTPEDAQPFAMQEKIPKKGQSVIAIGSPNGLDDSVSTGIVSGVERSVKIETPFSVPDSIQTDAALNPGNSGGPLINSDNGAVVGVNRATEGENIGQAVSARLADRIGKSLIETGNHQHSYIGVVTVELTPLTQSDYDLGDVHNGLVVMETFENTPGREAFRGAQGNKTPDVILSVEGHKLNDNEDLASYMMRKTSPGDKVTFTVYRDGEKQQVTAELSSRSEAEDV